MSGRWVAGAVAGFAVVVLAGCGSTPAPGGVPTGTAGTRAATTRPVTSQRTGADGALACPATVPDAEGMTVPEKPEGVAGKLRLLPDRPTSSMVVCAYPVMDLNATQPLTPPFKVSTRMVATQEQSAEVTDLFTWAPRGDGTPEVCTMMGGNETAYLVGAVYTDAIVWVAAKDDPNSCSGSTNGEFVSSAPLGVPLAAMFGGGRSTPTTPVDPCIGRSYGRLGDDLSLAPEGDPIVTVCRMDAQSHELARRLDPSQSRQVVDALRALATRPTRQTCEGSGKTSDHRFALWLDYGVGPKVRIQVDPTCAPQVLGSNLEADDAGDLVSLVEQWSTPVKGPDPNGSVSSGGEGPDPAPGALPVQTS